MEVPWEVNKKLTWMVGRLIFRASVMVHVELFSNAHSDQGEKEHPKHWAAEKYRPVENLLVPTEKL